MVLAHFQSHASAVSSFELCRSLATSATIRSATSVAAAAASGAIDAPAAKDAPSTAKTNDTYLNIASGDALLDAYKRCLASNFTDRSIHYKYDKKFVTLKSIYPSWS